MNVAAPGEHRAAMRIGFDGLSITARPAGSGGVARSLLVAMAKSPRRPTIVAVLPRGSAADDVVASLPNVEVIRAPVAGPDTPRALLYQHLTMPRLLARAGIDVHVGASFVLPTRDVGVPSVVIVHDVSWRLFPETKTARFRAYMDFVVPRSLRRARVVVTAAESAADDVAAFAPDVDRRKIRVVPWGVAPAPALPPAIHGSSRPYVLSVSNFDKRKNLPALVAAWRRLVAEGDPHDLRLVGGDEMRRAVLRADVEEEIGRRLFTPGYVDAATLATLYAEADLVVVPSLYEGFGLPVLEAFAAGVPVACSNTSSLPEVADDAAVLFDPADVGDIARGMREALRPGPERDARVARGRARAAAATWERCAERFVDAVEAAATS